MDLKSINELANNTLKTIQVGSLENGLPVLRLDCSEFSMYLVAFEDLCKVEGLCKIYKAGWQELKNHDDITEIKDDLLCFFKDDNAFALYRNLPNLRTAGR